MKTVEFRMDHPVLFTTLEEYPSVELEWVQSDLLQDEGVLRSVFIVRAENFERFQESTASDSAVREVRVLGEFSDTSIYQIDFQLPTSMMDLYPRVVDMGGVIDSFDWMNGHWDVSIAFPDDESVSGFFHLLSNHEIDYKVIRVRDRAEQHLHSDHGLSEPQAECLQEALKLGYLEIPRKATLEELGAALGISDQAASERFRRGIKHLVENVLEAEKPAADGEG